MARDTGTRVAGWMILTSLPLLVAGTALFVATLPTVDAFSFDTPELRQLALLIMGAGLVLLGLLLGVLGLALYVLIPAFSGPERAARDYGSHRVVVTCTLLAIVAGNILAAMYLIPSALVLTSMRITPGGAEGVISPAGIAIAALSLDLALLAIVWLRVVRPGAITWKRMGIEREGLAGRLLIGLPLGVVLLATSAAVQLGLEAVGVRQTQSQIFGAVRGASLLEFAMVFLAGAVIAPVVEEIYFRGFVFRGYLDQKGERRAFAYSAGLFALIHLNLPALPPILIMGLLLAFIYHRTGSVIPGMVAHALNNATAFLLLYMGVQ